MKWSYSLFLAFVLLACEKTDWPRSSSQSIHYQFTNVQLGGTEEDVAHAVIATADGGFAVLGNTKSSNGDVADKTTEISDYYSSNTIQMANKNGALPTEAQEMIADTP